jgi:hypothetical protein
MTQCSAKLYSEFQVACHGHIDTCTEAMQRLNHILLPIQTLSYGFCASSDKQPVIVQPVIVHGYRELNFSHQLKELASWLKWSPS